MRPASIALENPANERLRTRNLDQVTIENGTNKKKYIKVSFVEKIQCLR
jgi:hypothetical protein